jgi:leucyl-tRNA synthetase
VLDPAAMTAAYTEDGIQVSSGPFDGMNNREAIEKISDYLQDKGFGGKTTSYRLRDWCISRQRYWGAPIPVIYCDSCGAVPVPDEQLPVLLPENVVFKAEGGSPLMRCEEFVHTRCPSCGGPGRRETDTMDTFMESSWYHLRYTSPRYELGLVNADEAKEWMPVDQYIGGIEHAVGHLVYSRFYHRLLREIGFVPKEVPAEPFPRLLTQGMVCMETLYTLDDHDQPVWHYPEDVENGLSKVNGQMVQTGRVEKMSKSKRNVVDTSEIIARYGVDSARMFTLFASPPENDLIWKDEGVEGIYRFLSRLWRIVWTRKDDIRGAAPYQGDGSDLPADFAMLRKQHHKTVKGVTEDIEGRFHFNTAISKCMELTNLLVKQSLPTGDAGSASVQRDAVFALIGLLTPFAPHICEELFEALGGQGQAALAPWPTFDPAVAADDVVTIAIQVLGKLRATMELPAGATKEEMEKAALENPNVQRHIEGKTLRKVIVVPGKLVNLVVG